MVSSGWIGVTAETAVSRAVRGRGERPVFISINHTRQTMNKHEFFRLLIAGELDNILAEPDEFTFIRMLKEQEEKRNGCRRKNTRNQHRGKRKAL